MITFLASVILLFAGYFIYSKILEKIFGIDSMRETPALKLRDNVDYVPLPWWRVFLIQFLNITGLGPIFGALLGAMYGPVAFLWIVIGNIFGGAMHDYFSGMISLRHDGKSLPEITGFYLGKYMKQFMRIFTLLLMILVGAVFVNGPASILHNLSNSYLPLHFWISIIFVYYFIATLLPVHKIISKIYPFFGAALAFMALGTLAMAFYHQLPFQDLTGSTFKNFRLNATEHPIFPLMFITIACGAISGFHATQSPMMARCLTNERYGRRVFYGAMIAEGLVALIWAAIGMAFWGGVKELNIIMMENKENAAWAVHTITSELLGTLGQLLAIIGVVAAPITSGDTAFRSARLIVADFLRLPQAALRNRLLITIPVFIIGFLLTQYDFGILWRYMAWSNQTLATITLWMITIFLVKTRKLYIISLIPALFMSVVCSSYILIAPEGFALPHITAYSISGIFTFLLLSSFVFYRLRLITKKSYE